MRQPCLKPNPDSGILVLGANRLACNGVEIEDDAVLELERAHLPDCGDHPRHVVRTPTE